MESKLRLIVLMCTFCLPASSFKNGYFCCCLFISLIPIIYDYESYDNRDEKLVSIHVDFLLLRIELVVSKI